MFLIKYLLNSTSLNSKLHDFLYFILLTLNFKSNTKIDCINLKNTFLIYEKNGLFFHIGVS